MLSAQPAGCRQWIREVKQVTFVCFSTSYRLTRTRRRLARRSTASMLDFPLFVCLVLFWIDCTFHYLSNSVQQRLCFFLTIYGVIQVVGFLAAWLHRVFVTARLCVRRTPKRLRDVCGQEGFGTSEDACKGKSLPQVLFYVL